MYAMALRPLHTLAFSIFESGGITKHLMTGPSGNSSLLPGQQFTVDRCCTCMMAGISVRFSNFAFVLFCYITNHLMTGPLGNSEFCFPRISMFPLTSSRETLRFSGKKIQGPVIKCLLVCLSGSLKYL